MSPAADPEEQRPDGVLDAVEELLLGERPHLTRVQVSAAAGVPLSDAEELWRQLGFPHHADDEVAFTEADVEALRLAHDLMAFGILSPESRAALVRTWGRSFARLADWQVALLARVANSVPGANPAEQLTMLTAEVMPRLEKLQAYAWRRHLASAGSRLIAVEDVTSPVVHLAVGFVDIVGFTSRSKTLGDGELVDWIEGFEDVASGIVLDRGGRIIKNIGDEVLFVADRPEDAVEIALAMTERGADEDDPFPAVRAGVAYGDVIARLGDVFGPTVNIAARLTSVARPGTVLIDAEAHGVLLGEPAEDDERPEEESGRSRSSRGEDDGPYRFRRVPRVSVKGYSRLEPWVVRRA